MKENEKVKRERLSKDWQNVTILNNFIFGRVMKNKTICKQFLELILNKEIQEIKFIEVEKHIKEFIDTRSVRLDVYVEVENEVYNIELQAKNVDDMPRRCRIHINNIDSNLMKPSMRFKDAKNVSIIFVCNFDSVGDGLPKYTTEKRYIENSTQFDDGTQVILLNATAYKKAKNEDLKAFLAFISGKEDIDNTFVNRIKKEINIIKQNEAEKEQFMTLSMLIEDERYEAEQKGIKKGIREGILQVVVNSLSSLDDNSIAKITDLPIEEIKKIRKEHENK